MKDKKKNAFSLLHPSSFMILCSSSRRDLHQLDAVALGETRGRPFGAQQGLPIILHEHEGSGKGEFGKKHLHRCGYDLFGSTIDEEKWHGAERQKAE
jgi:hypothetical protein